VRIRSMVWLTASLVAGSASAQLQVTPTAETDGVSTVTEVSGVAYWQSPLQPAQSLILLTDRTLGFGGLTVLGFDGRVQDSFLGGAFGVDVQEGFRFGTVGVPLVAVAFDPLLSLFRVVDQADGGVRLVQNTNASTSLTNVRSVKLFAMRDAGRFFAFVGNEQGQFQQLELRGESDGGITVTQGRLLSVPGPARALAVDEAAPALFIAQQSGELWRFDPTPDGPDAGTLLSLDGGSLGNDVQGLALYALPGGQGALVAVSGANGVSTFTVLDRQPPHAVRGTFLVGADGGIDGVESSRALALSSIPVPDAGYPGGLLIAVDNANTGGVPNAKLVSWSALAQLFAPPLPSSATDGGTADGGTDGGGGGGGGVGVIPPAPGGVPPETDDDGPVCSCAASSVPGAALLGLAAVLLSRRRRQEPPQG
jgi:3-phytase